VSDLARRRDPIGEAVDTFRLPYYRQLWLSNLITAACFQVQFLALQWLVTTLTSSRSALGIVAFATGGAVAAMSPVAGLLADRYPKRNLIGLGRLGITVVGAIVAWLIASGRIALWHILGASVVGGALVSLLGPAAQSYIADVVGRARVAQAVALGAMGASVALAGGAALGGVLIASIGLVPTWLGAAASVALAGVLVLAIPIRGEAARAAGGRSALRDVREVIAYVGSRPPLRLALLACAMALFNGALGAMRPFFARDVFGVDARGFGWLSASQGIGTIVAALGVTLFPPRRHLGVWIAGTMLAYAAGLVLYALSPSFGFALGVEFWLGLCGELWHVTAITGFQLAVPDHMRGRVLSAVFTFAQLGFLGSAAVGATADWLGDRWALGLFGAVPTAVLALLLARGHRTLRQM
jgi:MFS family permease